MISAAKNTPDNKIKKSPVTIFENINPVLYISYPIGNMMTPRIINVNGPLSFFCNLS
ncbi:hypothetical protein BG20_I2511, partial [Candidatus Nitrosarchaeum limnium BG20]